MNLNVLPDPQSAASAAAQFIQSSAEKTLRRKQVFSIALSGGSTPAIMLDELSKLSLPWSQIHFFQVDERVAPDGSPDRNATQLKDHFLAKVNIPSDNVHLVPVGAPGLESAARDYAATLKAVLGNEPIDLVHLGLGNDGHTASLAPNDDILEIQDQPVWFVAEYKGLPRISLTFPAINQARQRMWLATGKDKSEMLARLVAKDQSIPAGRVNQDATFLFTDKAAAGEINPN